jgi:hypothetical protein
MARLRGTIPYGCIYSLKVAVTFSNQFDRFVFSWFARLNATLFFLVAFNPVKLQLLFQSTTMIMSSIANANSTLLGAQSGICVCKSWGGI